ncbi:MAG: hypothetical protein EHM46_06925, partial [Bacteroidetes bacterium]
MKFSVIPVILLLSARLIPVSGQEIVTVRHDAIVLDNGSLVREIRAGEGAVTSVRLSMSGWEENYISEGREFSFLLNGRLVDGRSGWYVTESEQIRDERSGQGVRLRLRGREGLEDLQLDVHYMLYPGLPLVRKWLTFSNTGDGEMMLEAINVEDLQTVFSQIQTVVLHNYGRMKHLGSFTGNWYDPVVVLHNMPERRGMAAGNEAPGVLKRTAYHTVENNLEIGLTGTGQEF